MNLFTFAKEMTHPKMKVFLDTIIDHGEDEMNEESDIFGAYIKIYNDITIKRNHDIDCFTSYDCELDELGYGKITIQKDTYVDIENEYHLGIDGNHIASGSALWMIMRISDIIDECGRKPDTIQKYLKDYGHNKHYAIEGLFQEKLTDFTEIELFELKLLPETIYFIKQDNKDMTIQKLIDSVNYVGRGNVSKLMLHTFKDNVLQRMKDRISSSCEDNWSKNDLMEFIYSDWYDYKENENGFLIENREFTEEFKAEIYNAMCDMLENEMDVRTERNGQL